MNNAQPFAPGLKLNASSGFDCPEEVECKGRREMHGALVGVEEPGPQKIVPYF
jgi:hypothetical protein